MTQSSDKNEQRLVDAARQQVCGNGVSPTVPLSPQRLQTATSGAPPLITNESLPGYQILREIHRGGQGVVFQAIQESTSRKVAVKVMKEGPFAGEADKARFEREVRVLGQLQHPNIVAIHDSGEAAGRFYYVMDYIPGRPLDVHMASGAHSVRDTLQLFVKICDAVNAAHLRGVIHRDLKPSNLQIDPNDEPHVLDFGLAKLTTGETVNASLPRAMTMTGQFIGSLPWSSPEQAEGAPSKIDLRTDVYSLGVIAYQMLTGRFPYEVVGNMRDVLDRIMKVEPAKPSTIRKQIDDEVETIVLKCLTKERERRYQTAGELARDIRHYLAGEPIEAKRDSAWYVISKQLRRNKVPVVVAAAFVIVVTAGLVVSLSFWQGARRAREAETVQRQRAEAKAERLVTANKFLIDVLGMANPLSIRGRPFTFHSVLDEAVDGLEAGLLVDDAEMECDLRAALGSAYCGLGRLDLAEVQFRTALRLAERQFGPEDVRTGKRQLELGQLIAARGKNEAAVELIQTAIPVLSEKLPPDHTINLAARLDLAEARGDTQAFSELAEFVCQLTSGPVRGSGREAMHERHDRLVILGWCYVRMEEFAKAEQVLRDSLEEVSRAYGDDSLWVGSTVARLGIVLLEEGKNAEAEQSQRRALQILRGHLDTRHPQIGHCLVDLGFALLAQEKYREAEEAFRECLTIRQASTPKNWGTFDAMNALGAALAGQGRYAEAEPLLLDGYAGMAADVRAYPLRKRQAMERIIHLYEMWEKPGLAEQWRGRLDAAQPVPEAATEASTE